MGLIFSLSLRNLLRQKRRNFLLGMAISFGMMILVIANSFSHGMVDVLINEVVANAFGHIVIDNNYGSSFPVIRDRQKMETIIKETIAPEELDEINENLAIFGRAIGNGEADNIIVVGLEVNTEQKKKQVFNNFFTLVEGDFNDFYSNEYEYPVIISPEKAKSLNVKLHDVIKVRLPMVTGQIQAAQLTVVAIANANNTFMDIVAFMDAGRVKKLVGYKPWESSQIQITLKNPKKNAKLYADQLHQKLQPRLLTFTGNIDGESIQLVAFKNDNLTKDAIKKQINLVAGDYETVLGKKGVMLNRELAAKLKLQVGDEFIFTYLTKFRGDYEEKFTLEGIYESTGLLNKNIVLVNEERVHNFYNAYLPMNVGWEELNNQPAVANLITTEWKLLPRSKDNEELQKINRAERKLNSKQVKFNVVTMYEGASQILQLESALNLVTAGAILILFMIILVGVINTLRMTIKERTREIGTVRAIGMQKSDVRNMFLMETLLLTAISCITGIILGIIVMGILGLITFNIDNALSMILKDKHLNFKLNPVAVCISFIQIMIISLVTAYFPARRAAKLTAVEALRHYE
ncbi:MAG TPA: FtsX-like permease family protein [Bacillota bacterium]|nr:FtsX-like permease family protein [Bacillota bacterium]HOL09733.1 FtsX-like permease family protein [Bacillota bacterium]HPO98190.1 FtsX-like permease family protein [Bacillota bacterium]